MCFRDSECVGRQLGGMAGSILRKRAVLIGRKTWLGRRGRPTPPYEFLGLLDSGPTQVIDQFAGNAFQERGVGIAQEFEHNAPLAWGGCRGIGCPPALECGS